MLFYDPSCRSEVTLRENNALGMYALCQLDWVSICTKSDSGNIHIDAQINRNNVDPAIIDEFLLECGKDFQFNDQIESYRRPNGYFYKISIRQDEHYFVFSIYHRKSAPITSDNLAWLHLTSQIKYAYTLLNNESIQERELSERIVDSIDATILVIDLESNLVSVNGDLDNTFGFRFSSLHDPRLNNSVSSHSWRLLISTFQEVLIENKKRQLSNLVFRYDDCEHIINVTLSPLKDSKGRLAGVVLVCNDVTELRYMEHEFQQSKQFSLLGQIAAGLAHDVKNPLMNISGCARAVLKNAELPQEYQELLNIILHECGRINTVIEQMLSFGKVSTNNQPSDLDINTLLNNCVGVISRQKSIKQIDVSLEADPGIPSIHGDSSGIQQAFLNILVNALEAIPECGSVKVCSHLLENGEIQVEIEDDGCGIPEEMTKKLFSPYCSTTNTSGSSGLGLFLAKRVFDQHNASIEIRSRLGQGTRVTVTFHNT